MCPTLCRLLRGNMGETSAFLNPVRGEEKERSRGWNAEANFFSLSLLPRKSFRSRRTGIIYFLIFFFLRRLPLSIYLYDAYEMAFLIRHILIFLSLLVTTVHCKGSQRHASVILPAFLFLSSTRKVYFFLISWPAHFARHVGPQRVELPEVPGYD